MPTSSVPLFSRSPWVHLHWTALLIAGATICSPGLRAQSTAPKTIYYLDAAEQPIRSALVEGGDGNFYGTTYGTGTIRESYQWGTIFCLTPGGVRTILYTFSGGKDGANPNGLTLGKDGNFYGTTAYGGDHNAGTIFKVTAAGEFATLYSFANTTDPSPYPSAPMTQGTDGNFYGITTGLKGRSSDQGKRGSVFRITPKGEFTTLHNFNGADDGLYPESSLLQGHDGAFYGTTSEGGNAPNATPLGTIFRITPNGQFTTLHVFTGGDGSAPHALVQASDDSFYGTTSDDGGIPNTTVGFGTIFRMISDGTLTTLHTFYFDDGGLPAASLVLASDGNFYGTTNVGGRDANGQRAAGTLFRISPTGSFSVVCTFQNNAGTGTNPAAALIEGSDGLLYGLTGGSILGSNVSGGGTIYNLDIGLPIPAPTLTAIISGATSIAASRGKAKILIRRTGNASLPLTARYVLRGTARNGIDYQPLSGDVTFAPGKTTAKVKILPINNETMDGQSTTATVKLKPPSDGSYVVGAPAKASVQIIESQ